MTRGVAITLFLFVATVCADDFDAWTDASPDKKLFAVVRRVPEPDLPSRLDLDGFTVFICTAEGRVQHSILAQHTFPRRLVSQIRWSPNSQFLLFTTVSSGGHSPWHVNTYVFCAADKSFRDVESATHATVGATEFHFEPPDIAVLTVNEVPAESVKQIKLPLGKTAQQMQPVP
jgi:dipeptidyl aminopeptidase/acylaminoacyl peptidase